MQVASPACYRYQPSLGFIEARFLINKYPSDTFRETDLSWWQTGEVSRLKGIPQMSDTAQMWWISADATHTANTF